MNQFTKLTSGLACVPFRDVDTDQIIPATYLKVTTKEGLADGLFARWRYQDNGEPIPDFTLNQPHCIGAQILLAGDNFGTGSSREHAAWALLGWGFRAVISTSFADIFSNNALGNGLLPVVVDEQTHSQLLSLIEEDPNTRITIDLANQMLTLPDKRQVKFPIDPFSKMCLLEGIDQLGYLLKHEPEIASFEETWESDSLLQAGV